MEIKMLKSVPGSIDGIVTHLFKKGQIYDSTMIGDKLTKVFLKEDYAEEISSEHHTPEEKMLNVSPENKEINLSEEIKVDVIEENVLDDLLSKKKVKRGR